jgi:hypothetical protein
MEGWVLSDTPARRERSCLLNSLSHNLEELHVAYLYDAEHFFVDLDTWPKVAPTTWTRMTRISFTSELLVYNKFPLDADAKWYTPDDEVRIQPDWQVLYDMGKLLMAAARAAQRMPRLEVMELWNTCARASTIFRYRRQPEGQTDPPRIELNSSWNARFSPDVLRAWEVTAKAHTGLDGLKVVCGTLPAVPRKRVAFFIDNLESRKKLLTDTSRIQLRWEAEENFWHWPFQT